VRAIKQRAARWQSIRSILHWRVQLGGRALISIRQAGGGGIITRRSRDKWPADGRAGERAGSCARSRPANLHEMNNNLAASLHTQQQQPEFNNVQRLVGGWLDAGCAAGSMEKVTLL